MRLLALSFSSDKEHAALPSAFGDAAAANHCITLASGSSVASCGMHGGGRMLEVKDALGHHVKFTLTDGGSAAQLDMWALMINKASATAAAAAAHGN
jgi:hypothetical protein